MPARLGFKIDPQGGILCSGIGGKRLGSQPGNAYMVADKLFCGARKCGHQESCERQSEDKSDDNSRINSMRCVGKARVRILMNLVRHALSLFNCKKNGLKTNNNKELAAILDSGSIKHKLLRQI